MRAFAAGAQWQATVLKEFGQMVKTHLNSRQHTVVPDTTCMPQRGHTGWDDQPTIFSFGLRTPDIAGGALDMAELAQVHRWLYSDISHSVSGRLAARACLIGQPVQVDLRHGRAVGVLRIAAGARLVSDSIVDGCLDRA